MKSLKTRMSLLMKTHSSTALEAESDTSSSNNEDANMAFLLINRDFEHTQTVAFMNKIEDDCEGPYEVIEGMMQPKVDLAKKKELMVKIFRPWKRSNI